jgi:hypothetical protein
MVNPGTVHSASASTVRRQAGAVGKSWQWPRHRRTVRPSKGTQTETILRILQRPPAFGLDFIAAPCK